MTDSHLTKICSVCQQQLPLDQFHKSKGGKYGVKGLCQSCANEYAKNTTNSYVPDPSKPVPVKTCTSCKQEKPITDFYKAKHGKYGKASLCKVCSQQKNKKRIFTFDPEKFGENITCSVCKEAKHHSMFNNDKIIRNGKSSLCKDCLSNIKAQKNNVPEANYESKFRLCSTCGEEKPGLEFNKRKAGKGGLCSQCKECDSKYRKGNPHISTAIAARRRSIKKKAIPKWYDKEKVDAIYAECAITTKETGVMHHVDHIVPLQSKWVCGLHTIENLRIITATDNQHKLNSHWPDMPDKKYRSVAATKENLAKLPKA